MRTTVQEPAARRRASARIVTGVLAGVAAAMAVIMVLEAVNGLLFPLPAIDWADAGAVLRVMTVMPFGAQALIVGGWGLGALVGAGVAVAVGRQAWAGWFPVGSTLVGGAINALAIDHPLWMDVGAVAAPILGGAIGIALTRRYAVA